MNGEPLPLEHGFPVRMVVPGLYGYVSATKWVVELKVTRSTDDEAYWTPRGWSARGPIKTASRIDVPAGGARRQGGHGRRRRRRLGPAPRHRKASRSRSTTGRGSRRTLAAEREHRHLAAVGLRLGRDPRQPRRPRPRHRRQGPGADPSSRRRPRPTAPPASTSSTSPWSDARGLFGCAAAAEPTSASRLDLDELVGVR